MLGGRCADLLGRRRVFLAGTALFSLASLACALADSARACCSARGRSRASAARSSRRRRSRSSRARSRPGPSATAPSACGARWARLGGVLGRAARRRAHPGPRLAGDLRRQRPARRRRDRAGAAPDPGLARGAGTRNFDVAGAVLITASLVSLTFGIVRTDTLGWGSAGVLVPLALGAALLAAFAARRDAGRRRSRSCPCRCSGTPSCGSPTWS